MEHHSNLSPVVAVHNTYLIGRRQPPLAGHAASGINQTGYHKEIYLVLSATTKYRDLMEIVDIYDEISDYKLIFTKLDETSSYGNLLNIRLYADAELSYVTTGQSVPDDIEVFDTQKIVKQLLGGK